MLKRGFENVVILVKGTSTAHEQQGQACLPRAEAEVGILAAIAGKRFIKPAQIKKSLAMQAECQRPEKTGIVLLTQTVCRKVSNRMSMRPRKKIRFLPFATGIVRAKIAYVGADQRVMVFQALRDGPC